MLIQFPLLYRRYGVRRQGQLAKPPIPQLSDFSLPSNSIYHYLGVGPLDDGPNAGDNAFKSITKPMQLETVTELTETLGNPRRLVTDTARLIRDHRVKNQRFRQLRGMEQALRDDQTLIAFNYSYIQRIYQYQRNYYAAYNRWHNALATMLKNVTELGRTTNRHQFIEFDLPKLLPSVSNLRTAERSINQMSAELFSTPEMIVLLELWKWLGESRKSSLFGDARSMERVNLVFRDAGRFMLINLGEVNRFRVATKEEVEEAKSAGTEVNVRGIAASQLQKHFLHGALVLTGARNGVTDDNLDPDVKEERDGPKSSVEVTQPKDQNQIVNKASLVEEDSVDEEAEHLSELERAEEIGLVGTQIEDNLDALEEIERVAEERVAFDQALKEDQISAPIITAANSPEGSIVELANSLAEDGGLSAAEYRRAIESAAAYRNISAPNGENLGKFINVTKSMVVMNESPSMPDKATVLDKSMLKSSLIDFDQRYVKDVMQRDIAGMVVNLQHAGIVVQDYEVEEVQSITGDYFAYAVKVKPLQGSSSTLRFRIPKVEKDGTYKINGVNYRTRKQRGD